MQVVRDLAADEESVVHPSHTHGRFLGRNVIGQSEGVSQNRVDQSLLPNADTKAQKLIIGQEQSGLKASECDLLVALDCADSKRLGEYEKFFISHPNTAAIDHHITHIPYAKLWIAYDISSTCEAMPKIIDSLGVQLTHDIAQNLYIGIATDTGSIK